MGVSNYYKILKVNLNATCERARKGFKRLAMLWNSDKNINQQLRDATMIEEAEVKIEQIPEAYGYEMLCDPKKRVICDFRRSRNPVVVVEYNLECTLEQLYNGCRRKVKIKNVVPDQLFRMWKEGEEEIFIIDIMPGSKKGSKITFPKNASETTHARDTIFVLDEKPHAFFMRDGDDLVLTYKISLVESLTGMTLHVPTLDGRDMKIEVPDIVTPGYVGMVPNEGMPIRREAGKKGNLYMKFDIMFPSTRLTMQQKYELNKILNGPFD